MKKLAKLTAVFAGICFVLAISACSHSGKEYDWKNPNGGSGSEPNEVLTLTSGGETYVFYDDMSFTYESSSGEKTKGTYTGDPSKDGELKLFVTSGYWNGEWKAPDNDYGIYFVIEGDSFTGYNWWMEDGKEVKDEENPKTFTKVEEEEEPETEGGTTPENPEDTEGGSGGDDTSDPTEEEPESYVASKEDYYGTWKADWSSENYYAYIVIEENSNTYYYYNVGENNSILSNSEKGTWTYDESSNKMTLSAGYWYGGNGTYSEGYESNGSEWTTVSNSYGHYIETTSVTSAEVTGWDSSSGVNNYSDSYTKQ